MVKQWRLYTTPENEKIYMLPKDATSDMKLLEHTCVLTGKKFNIRKEFWEYIEESKIDPDNMTYERIETCKNTELMDKSYLEWLWSNYFEQNGTKKKLSNLIGSINLELYIILLKVYRGEMDIDECFEGNVKESVEEETKSQKSNIENAEMINKKIKVLDLFCGCGGFTKGLEDAGLDVIAGIDHWNPAVESYRKNFNHICLENDLTTYTPDKFYQETGIKDIDLLVGGPPCQGFSMAGKRDKKDPRNSLFMEYVKYLNYFKPKMFIMENVRGILSMKTSNGTYVKELILNELTKEYNCIPFSLYARDFEVPQIRNRVLFIGIRKDLEKVPIQPEKINPDNHIPVSTILLPEDQVTTGYLSEKAITGIHNKLTRMKEKGYGFGAQFLKMDKPSYTIPARYHKDGYDALVKYSDTKIRKLTVTELKRIQTFGDDFILHGDYKEQVMQIGNAVASRFAYHIGKYVIDTLQ
jgi:DNA (cytosine-5)-methyltransferase 1